MSRARSRTGLRRQLSVVLLGLVPLLPTGCGSRYSTADFARAAGDTGSDEAARPSAGDTVPGPQTTAGGGADGTAAETPSPAATATASGGRPSGSGSTSAASGGTGGGSGAGTAAGSGTSTGPAATPAGKPPTGGASTVSPTAGPSGPKAEIVLGTFGTESGPVGANVVTAPVGIRAWLASINARGGLNGHPVRIIFGGDDGGDPARALAITRRLVEDDKVIGLLTPYSPTGLGQAYPFLIQRNVPVIAVAATVVNSETFPVDFNPATSYIGYGAGWLGAFLKQTTVRKIAVLYLREVAVAVDTAKQVRSYSKTVGVDVVYDAAVSIAQPDFTAEVISARNAGAELVMGVVDLQTMLRIIRSANRQGWKPLYSGSNNFDTEAIRQVASDVEGIMGFSVTVNHAAPQLADYRAAVARYVPGGEIGLLGPVAWAGGKILERIATRFDNTPTSAELIDALYTIHDDTLGDIVPRFSFVRSQGAPNLNLCVQPIRFVGGQWTQPLGSTYFECKQ